MSRGRGRGPGKIKRVRKTAAERELEAIVSKAGEIGLPAVQIANGNFALTHIGRVDKGVKVTTNITLINHGGTPIARWKAAKLLSDSQIAAIDHCEALWSALNRKSLVMNYAGAQGRALNSSAGWREQEALDDLRRIKGYVPAKYWAIFESVCRFDEPAGFAGSRLTDSKNDQSTAARITVQFVADIIAMKERLSC